MNHKNFFIFLIFIFVFANTASLALAKTYDLEIKKEKVFITGKAVEAMTINGQIPAPTLNFKEGEEVIINVKNLMDEETSLHWHGLLLDGAMDGVPGLNGFNGIAPHTSFTYKFKIRQAGTYWYHSHSNLQEQQGLYGAIVIEPKNNIEVSGSGSPCLGGLERKKNSKTVFSDKGHERSESLSCASTTMGAHKIDKDYVVLLSDFSEENPSTILNNLKMDSGYYNYNKRTVGTFFDDAKKYGFYATLKDYLDWGKMRMDPTDLADVSKYHFLINGKTADQNWTGIFKKNERVKLRIINASAMTIYDLSIPNLKIKVVEADGQKIKPITVDELRIAPAETYDVVVELLDEKAYTIFAQSIDRTGYALGTLATKDGMEGKIPPMRKRTTLTMADMKMEGMDHSKMDHSKMNEIDMKNMQSGWQDRGTPEGNKALEYSDLISFYPQKDLREPTKEIEFRFGGTMSRYIWTINGEKFPKPMHIKFGERIRLKFINDTMMAHPIHLHGMFMQLENGQSAKWMPNKHTIIVPPASEISVLLTANEEGEWAFHCHLLYHMASGMMTNIKILPKP